MALQKVPISVPLGRGVDTKTADALILPAQLSRLENGIFTRPGELQKRPGAAALAGPGLAATAAFQGSLGTFEQELVLAGGGSLLGYSSRGPGHWYSKGNLRDVRAQSAGIHADRYEQTFADCATLDGITLHAFQSTAGGIYAVAVDEATGTRCGSLVLVEAVDGGHPQVVAYGGHLWIFWVDFLAQELMFTRTNPGAPEAFTVPAVVNLPYLLNSLAFGEYFSLKPFGDFLALACIDESGDVRLEAISTAGAVGTLANGLPLGVRVGVFDADAGGLNLAPTDTHLFVLVGYNNTSELLVAAYDTTFANTRAYANVGGVQPSGWINNLTGVAEPGGTSLRCYLELDPTIAGASGSTYNALVRQVVIPADNTAASAVSDFRRSVGLATEAFLQGGVPHVGVVFGSTVQPTVFLCDSSARVVAKALVWKAGGLIGFPRLPGVHSVSDGKWITAVGSKGRFVSEAGQVTYSTKAISKVTFDFGSERYRNVQLGRNLHIAGGVVSAYDGAQVYEHGFHNYPERPAGQLGSFGALIVDFGQSTKRQRFRIVPPDADRSVQPVVQAGARVRPGEYVVLYDSETLGGSRIIFWFTVDGVGTSPGFGGVLEQVNLLSTDTQADICRKMAEKYVSDIINLVHPIMTVSVVAQGAGYAVEFQTEADTGPYCMPVGDTDFGYNVTQVGTAAQTEKTRLICPAGKWLSSGQWFQLESSYTDFATFGDTLNTVRLFYFVVDAVAPSPVPSSPGAPVSVPIAVSSTDNASAVAEKVRTAINNYRRLAKQLWVATISAPAVDISCPVDALGGTFGIINLTSEQGRTRVNDVGGGLDAGTRQYFACYSWIDAQGQYHRSAPSLPFTAAIQARDFTGAPSYPGGSSASPGNDQATRATCIIAVPTYRMGQRDPLSVQIELYRTEKEGVVPYLVATKPNDAAADSVSFTDALEDSEIINALPLYTAGGELAAVPPPGSPVLAAHRSRLFALDPDDADLVWVSKERSPGNAIEFSDALTVRVDSAGGEITAIWPQDDRTVIFKRRRILAFAGSGPDAAGNQSSWTPPELVNTDVGCVSADSLVFSPAGTFFKSEKGIYLLSRSLDVQYIGAPVEAFNGQTITAAVLLPGVSQVRFTTDAGVTLCYDYLAEQWSTFTFAAVHALIWDGAFHRLTSAGAVLRESPGAYLDAGVAVRLMARTSWLKPGEVVQGFGRVYRALLLGRYLSKHRLIIGIAYDYVDQVVEQYVFDAGADPALGGGAAYGTGTYGAEDPYGGTLLPALEQIDIRPANQKCSAIRFDITEDPTDGGEGLALVHLQLLVGVKGPIRKVPAARVAS